MKGIVNERKKKKRNCGLKAHHFLTDKEITKWKEETRHNYKLNYWQKRRTIHSKCQGKRQTQRRYCEQRKANMKIIVSSSQELNRDTKTHSITVIEPDSVFDVSANSFPAPITPSSLLTHIWAQWQEAPLLPPLALGERSNPHKPHKLPQLCGEPSVRPHSLIIKPVALSSCFWTCQEFLLLSPESHMM